MAAGISLHIGLNEVDPAHYDGWVGTLTACEADAKAMHAIAKQREFEDSTILLTREATSKEVIAQIERAAKALGAGDIFFISYAGHGGQVPEATRDDETDGSDETWLLYDRQLVDDELYALWTTFKEGVRIVATSDSCHSGTVTRGIEGPVPNPVETAEIAEQQSPRFRAMPRDTMVATYRANKKTYDAIQEKTKSSKQSQAELGARVLLISGSQDDQLSSDGFANGRFTEELLKVWADGAWRGGYKAFHAKILEGMPPEQSPNLFMVGRKNPEFERQEPFAIG